MPYIHAEHRKRNLKLKDSGYGPLLDNSGTLNYEISLLIRRYLDTHKLSYQTCNDIVGALDNSKDEFRRRIQHPYEDSKIQTNGDIY